MGERLTGGLTDRLPFNQGLGNESWRNWIADAWNIPRPRLAGVSKLQNTGYAVGMMERALKGEVKAFFFVYATHIDLPDVYNLVRPAITKTFNVVQEIYRHAPNNLYADVIFPAATWGEVEGIYISSERRLNICQKAAEPPPGCRPDLDMVIDKAKGIGKLLGLDMEAALPYLTSARKMASTTRKRFSATSWRPRPERIRI
jgi:nitrate reductase NapA